ncbi:capsid protein [Chifec virus UA13_77]|nr:capsid protein [Chifec virus UA13_77]
MPYKRRKYGRKPLRNYYRMGAGYRRMRNYLNRRKRMMNRRAYPKRRMWFTAQKRRIYSRTYRRPRFKQVVNTCTINATHTIDVWNKSNTWQKLPGDGKGWIWDTKPTVMQAHLGNVYCRNMFQTYKHKILKKVVVTFEVCRETLETHEALKLNFNDTDKTIKGEINNYHIQFSGATQWYHETHTRYTDVHVDDVAKTNRNFKGQGYGKKYRYTWYPGCKATITKNWDELAREDVWNKGSANITGICDGITKCYADGDIKPNPDIYMRTRSESYQRLYEITIKTYWNMWDMYKIFVEKPGITFENMTINVDKDYLGVSFPFDSSHSEMVNKIYLKASDQILRIVTDYQEYEIGNVEFK